MPTQPAAFSLISPADGDTIDHEDSLLWVTFQWQASRDDDNNDALTYRLELWHDEDDREPLVRDSLTQTRLTINQWDWQGFTFNSGIYHWAVKAEDLNSEGRRSNIVFSFDTYWEDLPPPPPENHPPSAFGLVSPEDSAQFDNIANPTEVTFSWERSFDPDSGAAVTYIIQGYLVSIFESDSLVFEQITNDTTTFYDINNLQDTLRYWDYRIRWSVRACSQEDTTSCNSDFKFYYSYERSVLGENTVPVRSIELGSPHPNPFNSSTTISFTTGSAARPTRLAVYDMQGKPVADLMAGDPPFNSPPASKGGKRLVVWNAEGIAAGIYFVSLEAGGEVRTKKVVLVR